LSGVPRSLPPLVQAMRLQEKAKQVGFEWETKEQVWEKVKEEMDEVLIEVSKLDAEKRVEQSLESYDENNKLQLEKVEGEIGDLLFSIVNYARFLNIDPDNALAKTNKKFLSRFQSMEKIVATEGKIMTDLSLPEMDAIWNNVKKNEL
jgi:XTP/dITP diphosphohydrolase